MAVSSLIEAFVIRREITLSSSQQQYSHHKAECGCAACSAKRTMLFSTAEMEDVAVESSETDVVPDEVAALDGIESEEEAHNSERPARRSLKKKGPRGKPLSELTAGETVEGRVKTITAYGAFVDIGAQTDGLLHISQLSTEYVSDVKEVLTVGQSIQARILSIDEGKNQVALSLLTAAQEQEAKDAQQSRASRGGQSRDRQERGGSQQQRRDDSATLAALVDKGWNPDQFVTGTVVSTVDFGAFVRIDASQLNSDVEGELDGLVHISCLTPGRASSVTSVVKVDDKVQVRVKGIANKKVSLSMISSEQEQESQSSGTGGGAPAPSEAKDWQGSVAKIQADMPKFQNRPLVVDMRK
jgi:predicted RNA-binding protein with RPS1 domain